MPGTMDREERDKLLDYLNKNRLPFPGYRFEQEPGGKMKQLGEGGFAIVYEGSGRNVNTIRAIKVIGFQSANTDSQDAEQFQKEIALQSNLARECLNIVQIDDANSLNVKFDEEGEVLEVLYGDQDVDNPDEYRLFQFILMEKLSPIVRLTKNGVPQILAKDLGNFSEKEVIRFALDIANALTEAHKQNVVHRDVKLENTFLEERSGSYKLGDFGIAKVTEDGRASTRAGTRGNIAPEAETEREYDGQKADIYSFGIMIYLLLNDLKYPASNTYKTNREVQYNPKRQPLPAPKNGSSELSRVVLKACSFYPDERYASMENLMEDLRKLAAETEKRSGDANNIDGVGNSVAQNAAKEIESLKKEEFPEEEGIVVSEYQKRPAAPEISIRAKKKTKVEVDSDKAETQKKSARKDEKKAKPEADVKKQKSDAKDLKAEEKKKAGKLQSAMEDVFAQTPEDKAQQEARQALEEAAKEKMRKKSEPNIIWGTVGVLMLFFAFLQLIIHYAPGRIPNGFSISLTLLVVLNLVSGFLIYKAQKNTYEIKRVGMRLQNLYSLGNSEQEIKKEQKSSPGKTAAWICGLAAAVMGIVCCVNLGTNWIFVLLTVFALLSVVTKCWSTQIAVGFASLALLLMSVAGMDLSGLAMKSDSYGFLFAFGLLGFFQGFRHFSVPAMNERFMISFGQVAISLIVAVAGIILLILGKMPSAGINAVWVQMHVTMAGLLSAVIGLIHGVFSDI